MAFSQGHWHPDMLFTGCKSIWKTSKWGCRLAGVHRQNDANKKKQEIWTTSEHISNSAYLFIRFQKYYSSTISPQCSFFFPLELPQCHSSLFIKIVYSAPFPNVFINLELLCKHLCKNDSERLLRFFLPFFHHFLNTITTCSSTKMHLCLQLVCA